jgi:protoporphyrinogen IX oxidase
MIEWLKIVHIATLVVWCGGLLVLPGLFAQRPVGHEGPALWRLQRFARDGYTKIVSPAALVAIGSGTALIFAREVFTVWFALKLLAVGALAGIHVRAGYLIMDVFEKGGDYAHWRRIVTQVATVMVIVAILYLVLAKPNVDFEILPDWFHQPGGLRSASEMLMPIP